MKVSFNISAKFRAWFIKLEFGLNNKDSE